MADTFELINNDEVRSALSIKQVAKGEPVSRVTRGMLQALQEPMRTRQALVVFGIVGPSATLDRGKFYDVPSDEAIRTAPAMYLLSDDELAEARIRILEYLAHLLRNSIPLLEHLDEEDREVLQHDLRAALQRLERLG